MSKQPYIPLYTGDWEKDTNCLSLEAEGALLKLIFKLWDSDDRGRAEFSFTRLSILFKKSEESTRKIIAELAENNTLNVFFIGKDHIKFESRRMLKDIAKSLIYKENGSKGGRPKKAKQNLTKSKTKAKEKLFTDNDIDNEYDNVIENRKGGTGEKQTSIAYRVIQKLNEVAGRNFRPETKAYHKGINARIMEGFTEADLFGIIENRTKAWKGTDMEQHLTPDTLFSTKAHKYRDMIGVVIPIAQNKDAQPEGRYAHERKTIFDKA